MQREKYPANWEEFSRFIRFERAQNKCESCGIPNYAFRYKSPLLDNGEEIVLKSEEDKLIALEAYLFDTKFEVTKIILTVAHLDTLDGICDCEKQTGMKCAEPSHVLALCQSCHLAMDIERHKFNRRRNHAASVGQLWLGDMEDRFALAKQNTEKS